MADWSKETYDPAPTFCNHEFLSRLADWMRGARVDPSSAFHMVQWWMDHDRAWRGDAGNGTHAECGGLPTPLARARSAALGFLAHYSIMPLTGWLLGRALHLEPGMAVGLILVASCPSGTASNVVSYLAKVDVALAVSVTLTSTLFAFVMTPLWCQLLAGHYVPVDALGLCLSTLKAVVGPVLIGVLCNWKLPGLVRKVSLFGPAVSVVAVVLITAGIVSQNAQAVIDNAGKLVLAALLLHVLGFVLGYVVARLLGYPLITARTISIEVGMQNGGMAAMLAKKNFPMEPLAAVPAVFSGVIQNLLGSIIAARWSKRSVEDVKPLETPEAAKRL